VHINQIQFFLGYSMNLRYLFTAGVMLSLSAVANASSLTYNVNELNQGWSVTGTITTDGSLGTLNASDLTDFNLLLNDGTNTFVLNTGDGQLDLFGTALTATSTGLFFDYSQNAFVLFQSPVIGSGTDLFCYQGFDSACFSSSIQGQDGERIGNDSILSVTKSGDLEIATTGAPSAVPEPDSIVLLGTGVLGAASVIRRRLIRS
jgi:hypothetical protein